MNNKRPQLPLFIIAFMGHILFIFLLWVFINLEEVQDPVYEKIISVELTTKVPSKVPPLNEAQRKEIADEKRRKEEAERKEDLKKAEQKKEQERKQKELDLKKKAETKKANEEKKKEEAKKAADLRKKKAAADAKKKADTEKQRQVEAKKKEESKKKAAEEARRKEAARQKAAEEARKKTAAAKAAKQRQVILGKHVNSAISERVEQEWNRLTFASVQFSDPNDYVEIRLIISKSGKVTFAKITEYAKNQALNSNAQTLFKRITSSTYRFPPFHRDYKSSSMTISFKLNTN